MKILSGLNSKRDVVSNPLLALAFKLEETQFGQLTYMRIYQGMLKKGNHIVNVNDGKKIKLARIVRMHSDEMEEIDEAHAGDVVAIWECFRHITDHVRLQMGAFRCCNGVGIGRFVFVCKPVLILGAGAPVQGIRHMTCGAPG